MSATNWVFISVGFGVFLYRSIPKVWKSVNWFLLRLLFSRKLYDKRYEEKAVKLNLPIFQCRYCKRKTLISSGSGKFSVCLIFFAVEAKKKGKNIREASIEMLCIKKLLFKKIWWALRLNTSCWRRGKYRYQIFSKSHCAAKRNTLVVKIWFLYSILERNKHRMRFHQPTNECSNLWHIAVSQQTFINTF